MLTLTQLREKRAARWADAQDYCQRYEAGEKLSRSDDEDWAAALKEFESLTRQLRSHPDYVDDQSAGAMPDVRGGGAAGRSTEFAAWLRTGDVTYLRAAGASTGAAGGYTVPQGFRAKITETLKAYGGVRRLAEVITTDDGATLPWPTNDDTSNVGAILTENTQATEQDVTFGQKQLTAYTYTSKIVRCSLQLAQDSATDIESWLARKLGQRIGRAQAAHFISGTGAGQPQGLITAATVGKTAASPTAFTYDELIDLMASVDAAYLVDGEPGVGWIMNQTTWAAVRKLKDSQNRPLVEPNLQTGKPTNLLGYEVVIDNGMAALTTGQKPIAFGNFRAGYVIRDVGAPEVRRLDERYMDFLQLGFIGWQRTDAAVQDASAFKVLQMA